MRFARRTTSSPFGRERDEALALADEQAEAKLLLEQLELLADAGLRGRKPVRGEGHVEPVLGDGEQVPELLEFHAANDITKAHTAPSNRYFRSRWRAATYMLVPNEPRQFRGNSRCDYFPLFADLRGRSVPGGRRRRGGAAQNPAPVVGRRAPR
jgi:hypothetical protein